MLDGRKSECFSRNRGPLVSKCKISVTSRPEIDFREYGLEVALSGETLVQHLLLDKSHR